MAQPPRVSREDYVGLVRMALAEDVGTGDVTTALTVPADAAARALISQKAPGVVYGHEVAAAVFGELEPRVTYEPLVAEGEWREAGEVASVSGPVAALLTGERAAMNFLIHLSGVATAAARATQAVAGTGCRILDTRKTTPGMRMLEKAAVAAGGAANHRIGLFDEILIKENHVAAAGGVGRAVELARRGSDLPMTVECQTLGDVDEALAAGAARLLLDNMSDQQLREAVAHVAGRAKLEASGGYTLENVRSAAESGVDFISMGSITHGAPALDMSMIVQRAGA